MAKITLNPIVGSYASVLAVNARLQQIEDAFNDDVLWRDGFTGEPNSMTVDLDMAGNTILNALLDVTTFTILQESISDVTATAAEVNILDGLTTTTTELNLLDGVTASTAELNLVDGVTASTAELNILDGVTSTASELNILDGVTASTTEINKLAGANGGDVTTTFDTWHLGGFASAPITANDGSVLREGMHYYNTGSNLTYSYDGTAWNSLTASAASNAVDVSISDIDSNFVATDVEAALEEISDNFEVLVYNATMSFDFAGANTQYLIATGDLTTLTTTNRRVGAKFSIMILGLSTTRNITYNTSWRKLGTPPTSVGVGKILKIDFSCIGGVESDVLVSAEVQI